MAESGRREFHQDEETGLPEIKRYEIKTPDGETATILYTGSAIWEFGEENIKKAFESAVDEGRVFILISDQDIAADVLFEYAEKNGLDPDDMEAVQRHYLETVFGPHLKEQLEGMSPEERDAFWQRQLDNRDQHGSHAAKGPGGVVMINVDMLQARTMFPSMKEALSAIFLLGHEFDHAENMGKHGRSPIGVMRSEAESDVAGINGIKQSGKDADGAVDKILFERSREAIVRSILEDVSGGRGFWKRAFGASLTDEFDHATSAIMTPEGELIPGIKDKDLEKSLKGLREKIAESITPEVQKDLLHGLIDDIAPGRSAAVAAAVMDELDTFLDGHPQAERYQSFSDNFKEQYDKAMEAIKAGEDPSTYLEAAKTEMKAMIEAMEENDPELLQKFLEKGDGARLVFAESMNKYGHSSDVNTALYKVLSQLNKDGAFKDDPVQQRVVDAFLKGPEVAPQSFDESVTRAPEQEQAPSTGAVPAAARAP